MANSLNNSVLLPPISGGAYQKEGDDESIG